MPQARNGNKVKPAKQSRPGRSCGSFGVVTAREVLKKLANVIEQGEYYQFMPVPLRLPGFEQEETLRICDIGEAVESERSRYLSVFKGDPTFAYLYDQLCDAKKHEAAEELLVTMIDYGNLVAFERNLLAHVKKQGPERFCCDLPWCSMSFESEEKWRQHVGQSHRHWLAWAKRGIIARDLNEAAVNLDDVVFLAIANLAQHEVARCIKDTAGL
ncbi:hypothetical protein BDZ85DRAFT_279440 [Elsinoe ampelina]|uniref:C2H2-type domain-containing protein n=1 Tax=Elsinoe ampelina TaxID=302913 RepID=A0A6A6GJW5_9PEZI|nr:hypothetical protein BDZ85DRAFT_279440 [Elsinoe ampelina]